MELLLSQWPPILVAAVVGFVASFLAWAVLPHHKPDFKTFKDEKAVKKAIRDLNIEPGQYMFPCCEDPSKLKDPEFRRLWEAGPHGVLRIWPAPPNMGRNMALTFLFFLVVAFFVAYVGSIALAPDAAFRPVFRLTGTVAVMAHTMGSVCHAIWFGRTFRAVVMDILDGTAYGLLTGVVFALMW